MIFDIQYFMLLTLRSRPNIIYYFQHTYLKQTFYTVQVPHERIHQKFKLWTSILAT